MNPDREPERPRALRIEIAPRTIGYVLLVAAGVWMIVQLSAVLVVILVALVLAGTLDPLVQWLERRGLRRGRALILLFLAITAAIGAILLLTVPPLISQLMHLIEDAPKTRDNIVRSLHGYPWAKPIVQAVKAIPVNDLVVRAGNGLIGYSEQILTVIGYTITTVVLAIYLLVDPVRARGMLYAVVPRNHHVKLARILLELKTIVGGYMRGQLITSISIGVFVFALLTAFRVEDALALALFAAMTDIIPFIGGYIASVPVIAAVAGSGSAAVIGVTAIMILYQEFESRILVPRVYGRVLRLPPAIVLIALLVGGMLMGILGALLALPIAAGIQMVVRELRVELPGESPSSDATRQRDEKAEGIYERLAEGATAADAGVIAGELAQQFKADEKQGGAVTAEMPAIVSSELSGGPQDNLPAAAVEPDDK
ncbi:MAG: family transporter [Deltaproteobacteria bacterium]|nr:family transporter [Deltaproteobacteria bacterium]